MRPEPPEPLEPRRLMAATIPSVQEVYMVELMNRARLDVAGEVKRFALGSINEGPPSTPLTTVSKQPLVINTKLTTAARGQATWQLAPPKGGNTTGGLQHVHDSKGPCERNVVAGYAGVGCAENLAFVSITGTAANTAATDQSHLLLFKDFTPTFEVAGRGHRLNILKADAKEIGVGVATGKFGSFNAQTTAQDLSSPASGSLVGGVVFTDAVKDDDFYTPGEGLGAIAIKAVRKSDGKVFSTKSWASGGYALLLQPGVYDISASGAALGATQKYAGVTIGSTNVKVDFVKPGTPDKAKPRAFLDRPNLSAAQGKWLEFTVTYLDTDAVNAATVGNADVQVVKAGYSQKGTLVSKTANGKAVRAVYKIPAAGGTWDAADNGTYVVKLLAGQVTDKVGNKSTLIEFGQFNVNIPIAAAAPKAMLAAAKADEPDAPADEMLDPEYVL